MSPVENFKKNYLHEFEHWGFERLCEEVAFDVVMYRGWVPTPMLIMWLTKMVEEQECQAGLLRLSSALS